jgi:hypothetical protein
MGGSLIVIDEAAIGRQNPPNACRAKSFARLAGAGSTALMDNLAIRFGRAFADRSSAAFFRDFGHAVESLGQVEQVFYDFCAPCLQR